MDGNELIPAWVQYKGSCGCLITYKASQLHKSECETHGAVTLKVVKQAEHTITVAQALTNRKKGQRLNG